MNLKKRNKNRKYSKEINFLYIYDLIYNVISQKLCEYSKLSFCKRHKIIIKWELFTSIIFYFFNVFILRNKDISVHFLGWSKPLQQLIMSINRSSIDILNVYLSNLAPSVI